MGEEDQSSGSGDASKGRPLLLAKELLRPTHPWPRYNRRLIIAGFVLLVIAAYSLYTTNAVHPYQSTFNVLAGKFFKIASNLRDQTVIQGQFQETQGRPVTFYLMSSSQFAAFQTGQSIDNLYSISDAASGTFSYVSTLPDTYYLVFTHGTGLLTITETVTFRRTYISLDEFQLVSGIILAVLGALELYWGLRPRRGPPFPLPPPGSRQGG